jgi:unsaturated chondroitin disaccharide hydrolase
MPLRIITIALAGFLIGITCCFRNNSGLDVKKNLDYCVVQADKTLKDIPADSVFPRQINSGKAEWRFIEKEEWTSGFWPGILWYLYEYTGNPKWKIQADKFTEYLTPLSQRTAIDHDLGFQMFCSFGNGYKLTQNQEYKKVILRTADTLARLYNPKVGTMLSWPFRVAKMNWPHNTIIDNMMNLEMLFWASKNRGKHSLYDMAVKHAEITMKNHFRADYSAYHVVVYDTITGKKIKGVTFQGYSDQSMWARGQAWAIYGFTMTYRETHDQRFLEFAQKVADIYLKRLPGDKVPYWDFDDPAIPNTTRDASAAAVTASALIELSTFVRDKAKAANYLHQSRLMLETLSGESFQSRSINHSFLLHSTGNKPFKSDIDCSIIYADYYYLEALIRLKRLDLYKNNINQPLLNCRN